MSAYDAGELLSDDQRASYLQIMKQKLQTSKSLILKQDHSTQFSQLKIEKIKQLMTFREDKNFSFFIAEPTQFFYMQWQFIKKSLPFNSGQQVTYLINERNRKVQNDLQYNRLEILEEKQIERYNYWEEEKNSQIFTLKGQSEEIKKKILQINSALEDIRVQEEVGGKKKNDIFSELYSEEKKREIQEYIRKKNDQKEVRKKRLQEQKKKAQQEFERRLDQQKQAKQKELKRKKEEKVKKMNQKMMRRQEEKTVRRQRQERYKEMIKKIEEKPMLFTKIEKNYEKQKEYEQLERRHQMINEKKAVFVPLQFLNIQEHERKYQQIMRMKAELRQKRYEQFLQQQQRNPKRRHSSFQFSKEGLNQGNKKQERRQKLQKLRRYESEIRQKYKPKIDEKKRKQMINLIEQMGLNNNKKLKKIIMQNGSMIYEEKKQANPREIGLIYLKNSKDTANKVKKTKIENTSVDTKKQIEIKKDPNYLEELKQKNKMKKGHRNFIKQGNLTFEERIKQIAIESQKLNEIVQQNEMRLKFGKFKTAEEILNCKQEIDNSYLDIAKMKIKLIKEKQT